jgi:hypothetical protein
MEAVVVAVAGLARSTLGCPPEKPLPVLLLVAADFNVEGSLLFEIGLYIQYAITIDRPLTVRNRVGLPRW